jgi:hypothetical protein
MSVTGGRSKETCSKRLGMTRERLRVFARAMRCARQRHGRSVLVSQSATNPLPSQIP